MVYEHVNSLSRRSLVRAGAAGAFLPLAGCLFGRDESEKGRDSVVFCEADVENLDESNTHDVRIQLFDGDEVRYETTETLSPYREDGWLWVITAEDLDRPRGAFVFRVQVDGGEWDAFDLTTISPTDAGAVATAALITGGNSVSFLESDDDNFDCDHLPTEDETVDNHD